MRYKEMNFQERKLFEALRNIKVIDAHEHLLPEKERIAGKVDFFVLFSHYAKIDLLSAGMNEEQYESLRDDQNMPIEEKWKMFSPFYPMIKHSSLVRPALIWLKEILGYNDLTKGNYKEASKRLQEGNTPGLYNRILRDLCHIETALICRDSYDEYDEHDFNILKPLWVVVKYFEKEYIQGYVKDLSDRKAGVLEDYLNWMEEEGKRLMKTGIFGIKIICFPFAKPEMRKAEEVFRTLCDKKTPDMTIAKKAPLISVIYDRVFQFARKYNLTVAVHSGVWRDFRETQPTHLIPTAMNYPDIQFDLFHLGMPYVREAVVIGKMFPNVSLNLCWTNVFSQEITVRMLDECLDMIPINNLIVFGADYVLPVENVYGHLKMAKENVTRVLSKRIKRGSLDFEEAMRSAKMWFYDNPVRIYKLQLNVERTDEGD